MSSCGHVALWRFGPLAIWPSAPARPILSPGLRPTRDAPITRLDPGWLFLLAGLAILAATILLPAKADLDEASWQRDRALAIESQRRERLLRHERYLRALEAREPGVVQSLAATQLHLVPEGRVPILPVNLNADASVFPTLEPAPIRLPDRRSVSSTLSALATGQQSRLWLIAGGAFCLMVGLLPPSRR